MTPQEITEAIRQIKRQFFMMRNGMMGDQLRRAGVPYRIIFGLNLPQVSAIARESPHDADLAMALWQNSGTRESLMIAPMLYPHDEATSVLARTWIETAPTVEAIDILCLRLIKGQPWAEELALNLLKPEIDIPLVRYAGLRILWNMLDDNTAAAMRPIVEAEVQSDAQTALTAKALLAQIDFFLEPLDSEENE